MRLERTGVELKEDGWIVDCDELSGRTDTTVYDGIEVYDGNRIEWRNDHRMDKYTDRRIE